MPKLRSPVLGFNHNVKHLGWVFHVQTEDSGIQNPHLFTHLFHGGVIIATKKMVYDAEADVDVVKGLMQAQHKSVLKELKSGTHDAKIRKYLGPAPADGAGAGATNPDEYADISIEEKTPTPTPVPIGPEATQPNTGPITVGSVADLAEQAGKAPPAGTAPPVQPADVSAAFRAISHASAQMAVPPRPPGTSTSPPPAGEGVVFGADPSAPPPPGSGTWSGKPEITQERPFDRGFIAAKTDPGKQGPGGPSVPVTPGKPPTNPPGTGKRPSGSMAAAAPPMPGGVIERKRPPTVPPGTRQTGPVPARPVQGAGAPAGKPPLAPARPPTVPPTAKPPTGAPVTARPPSAVPAVPPVGQRPPQPTTGARPPGPPVAKPPSVPPAGAAPAAGGTARPAGPAPVTARPPSATPGAPPAATRPGPPLPATPAPRPGTPNVVVARPAVIVGAPPQVVGGSGTNRPTAPARPREAAPDSLFGKDLISEKSLDEVIMAYLSEDTVDE